MRESTKLSLYVLLFSSVFLKPAYSAQGQASCAALSKLTYSVRGLTTLEYEGTSRNVAVDALVSLVAEQNTTTLSVIKLKMIISHGKVLKNPEGLEKPVTFSHDDRPALKNMITEIDDNPLSIAVKKSIINMLSKEAGNVNSFSHIKNMLNLLEEGKKKIFFDDLKDFTLILGNTGSGKSTFTNWISETDNKLLSIELSGGDYIVVDKRGKISNETIHSKTIFPERITDFKHNVTYYDMPGFSDTRSSVTDIATSFFISSVIEHATRVKIIFLINYSSVRKGNDRNDFVLFLQHATELLNDIDKYKDSIALVVTKVENMYKKRQLVEDEAIKKGIAEFLEEVKRSINTNFSKKAIQLINVFLSKNNNRYTKIGIFRRPDDSGSLNEIDLLEKEKNDVRNMIVYDLLYTESRSEDFSRTISEKSKNEIHIYMEDMEKNILLNICELSVIIEHNFQTILKDFHENITSIKIDDRVDAYNKLYQAENNIKVIHLKLKTIENLVDKILDEFDLENIPEHIATQVSSVDLKIPTKLLSDILNKGSYLKFLISSAHKETTIKLSQIAWASAFQSIIPDLNSQVNAIDLKLNDLKSNLEENVNKDLTKVTENMINHYILTEKNTSNIVQMQVYLKSQINVLVRMLQKSDEEFMSNLIEYLHFINVDYPSYIPSYVLKNQKSLNYSKEILGQVLNHLRESHIWYQYLFQLLKGLSHSNSNLNSPECYSIFKNVKLNAENEEIELSTFERLLRNCHPNGKYTTDYSEIKTIQLNESKLLYLNHLLDNFFADVSRTCRPNGTMIIKGFNVKISNVVNKTCPGPMKHLSIFALSTVLIDADLIKQGIESITIVAPKWNVHGKRSINLDGLPAKQHVNLKARSGSEYSKPGQDGKPGYPGGSGGIFLGIGDDFDNMEFLSISARGANGGRGQDGGDGAKGRDGEEIVIDDADFFLKQNGENIFDKIGPFKTIYGPFYGKECTAGGDGGKGGIGGAGGYGGAVQFVAINDPPVINREERKHGKEGLDGHPGDGGRAGRPGNLALIVKCGVSFLHTYKVMYKEDKECNAGLSPQDLNVSRMEPKLISFINKKVVLDEYKKFVTEKSDLVSNNTKTFLEKAYSAI